MQTEPLVSVIMPAYNAERFIAEAVQSVIEQSWQNWELIIVNDGSTDSTGSYLGSLSDSRIRVIQQENMGVSAARNLGLEIAKGEYITFLDADDALTVSSLECRVIYLESNFNIDVAHGIIETKNENLTENIARYKPFYYKDILQKSLKLDNKMFFNPCYLIRHSKIGEARFLQGMTHCEDILFLIHLFTLKLSYAFIDEIVYYYRVSDSSAMSNMQGIMQGYIDLLNNVMKIPTINYADTFTMRLKIARIFSSWHLRNGKIFGLSNVVGLFKVGKLKLIDKSYKTKRSVK